MSCRASIAQGVARQARQSRDSASRREKEKRRKGEAEGGLGLGLGLGCASAVASKSIHVQIVVATSSFSCCHAPFKLELPVSYSGALDAATWVPMSVLELARQAPAEDLPVFPLKRAASSRLPASSALPLVAPGSRLEVDNHTFLTSMQ